MKTSNPLHRLGLALLGLVLAATPLAADSDDVTTHFDRQIERLERQLNDIDGQSEVADAQREALMSAIESLHEARVEMRVRMAEAEERSSGLSWLFSRDRDRDRAKGDPEPYVGVTIESVPRVLRSYIDLPEGVGLMLVNVHKDSPAAKAGLEDDDIMIEFNNQLIVNFNQFSALVNMLNHEDTVPVKVLRKGEEMTFPLTIEERVRAGGRWLVPTPPESPAPPAPPAVPTGRLFHGDENGTFEILSPSSREGVVIDLSELEGLEVLGALESLENLEDLEVYLPLVEEYASQLAAHYSAQGVAAVREWMPGSVNVIIDDQEQVHVDLRDLKEELSDIEVKLHRMRAGDQAALEAIITEHGDLGARTTILHMENQNFAFKNKMGSAEIFFEDGERMARVVTHEGEELFVGPLPENYPETVPEAARPLLDRAFESQGQLDFELGDDSIEVEITTDEAIKLSLS